MEGGRDGGRGGGGEGSNELFALILMPLYSIKHPSEALNRTLTHSLAHTQNDTHVCVCVSCIHLQSLPVKTLQEPFSKWR